MSGTKSKWEIKRKIFCLIAALGCFLGAFVSFITPTATYLVNWLSGLIIHRENDFNIGMLIEYFFNGFGIVTFTFLLAGVLCTLRIFTTKVPLWPMVIPFFILFHQTANAGLDNAKVFLYEIVDTFEHSSLVFREVIGVITYLLASVAYLVEALAFLCLACFIFLRKGAGKILWIIPAGVFILYSGCWGIWRIGQWFAWSLEIPGLITTLFVLLLSVGYIVAVVMLCLGVAIDGACEKKMSETPKTVEVVEDVPAVEIVEVESVETVTTMEETELAETAQE